VQQADGLLDSRVRSPLVPNVHNLIGSRQRGGVDEIALRKRQRQRLLGV
jgi:hypothetical protein